MMDACIRIATKKDIDALRALWNYAFHDGETFQRWYFSQYFCPEECLVATVGEEIAASLQIVSLETVAQGRRIKTGYIVGVDSWPHYRGRGLTHKLMREVIDVYAPKHGIELLQLMPFEAEFYKQYGFVFSDYHANMSLPIEEFYQPSDKAAIGAYHWVPMNIAEIQRDDMVLLEHIYNKSCARYDYYVERKTARRWHALLDDMAMEDGHIMVLKHQNEGACGYIIYKFEGDTLFVREAQAINAGAQKALYYFIASHRSQIAKVVWSAAENERLIFTRAKDKTGVQLYPFMMSYIIQPEIAGCFATALPKRDVFFSVEGYGSYVWRKDTVTIETIQASKMNNMPALTKETLTALVFERGLWCEEAQELATCFKYKPLAFNNEYF